MVGRSYVINILAVLLFAVASWSCDKEIDPITYCDCSSWENWKNEKGVQCGFLTVPEDHSKPMGKSIKIAFAIFKSKNKSPDAIPVIYLPAGPGGRTLDSPDRWKDHEGRLVGDLIVVEQRGIGLSSPLPDISETFINIIAADASS
jgi:hypothetical protein